MAADFPPPGWSVSTGYLAEVRTVRGYYLRRCEVTGRCQRQDCRRSCYFDYVRLMKDGLADVDAGRIKTTFKCNRLDGCSLQFYEEPGLAISLDDLARHDNIAPKIRCTGCGHSVVTTTAALIRQLTDAGQGGGSDSSRNVGARIRGPCPKCKQATWEVTFLWHDPKGRIPIWRQDLQKRIDEAQRRRDLDSGLVC